MYSRVHWLIYASTEKKGCLFVRTADPRTSKCAASVAIMRFWAKRGKENAPLWEMW